MWDMLRIYSSKLIITSKRGVRGIYSGRGSFSESGVDSGDRRFRFSSGVSSGVINSRKVTSMTGEFS